MKLTSRRRGWQLLILLSVGTLALAACTRSATTETLPEDASAGEGEAETIGDVVVDQEANMNALLEQGQMTQTAEAGGDTGVGGGGEIPDAVETEPPPAEESTPEPTAIPVEPAAAPANPTTYTVLSGDWIYQIARNHGIDPQELIGANPGVNANNIQPGQVLNIPAPGDPVPGSAETGQTTYVVQPGDNLFRIARNYNMNYDALAAANGLAAPYTVFPGQVLTIPAT